MAGKLIPLKGKRNVGRIFQAAMARSESAPSSNHALRAQQARDRLRVQREAGRPQTVQHNLLQGRISNARRQAQAWGITLPQRQPLNAEGKAVGQRGFSTRAAYQPRA